MAAFKTKAVNFIKHKWIYIWVIAAAAALCAVTAWAAYSSGSNVMGRVIRNESDIKQAFTSNYLSQSNKLTKVGLPEINEDSADETYDVTVYLWNYNESNTIYEKDITYTVTATLTDRSGTPLSADSSVLNDNSVKIAYTGNGVSTTSTNSQTLDASNLTYTFTGCTIEQTGNETYGYESCENTFKLGFSKGCYGEEIYVKLEATPDATDLTKLSGIIGVTEESTAMPSQVWTVTLNEKPSDTENTTSTPDSYDGYNLIVQGSGKSTITIVINTTKLEVNPYFIDENRTVYDFADANTDDNEKEEVTYTVDNESGTVTITINANSTYSEKRSRYEIQLYKIADTSSMTKTSDWSTMIKEFTNASDISVSNYWIGYNVSKSKSEET